MDQKEVEDHLHHDHDNTNAECCPQPHPHQAPLSSSSSLAPIKLEKVPRHCGVKCQIYVKPEFQHPTTNIYAKLASALLDKVDLFTTTTTGDLNFKGHTISFGPDPEFCLYLQRQCVLRGYKLAAIISHNQNNNKKILRALEAFGAKVYFLNDDNESEASTGIGRIFEAASAKAQDLWEVKGYINAISLFLEDPSMFHPPIDSYIDEINITPNVYLGTLDPYGVLDYLSLKLPSKFEGCEVIAATSDILPPWYDNPPLPPPGVALRTIPVTEKEGYRIARDLNKKEDLLTGERGGVIVAASIKLMEESHFPQDPSFTLLCDLPDTLEHSEMKFLNIDFMRAQGYMSEEEFGSLYWWYYLGVTNLTFNTFHSVELQCSLDQARRILDLENVPRLLIWNGGNHKRDIKNVSGIMTKETLELIKANNMGQVETTTRISEVSTFLHPFETLSCLGKLGELETLFEHCQFVLLCNDIVEYSPDLGDTPSLFQTPMALVTPRETHAWIYSIEEHHRTQYGWEPGVGYLLNGEKDGGPEHSSSSTNDKEICAGCNQNDNNSSSNSNVSINADNANVNAEYINKNRD